MTNQTPPTLPNPTPKRTRNKHNVTFEALKTFLSSTIFNYTLKDAEEYFKTPASTLASLLFRNNTSIKQLKSGNPNDAIALYSYNNSISDTLLKYPKKTLKQIHSIRYNYRRKYNLTPELKPCPRQSNKK